ncbi:MAG: galactokinase [Clostridia bacterium]|nr:galactokinase [Clostridia bacterium]
MKNKLLNKTIVSISQIKSHFEKLYGGDYSFQEKRYENAFSNFKKTFGVKESFVASSSGRVEVIGNHTDHNGGRGISCSLSLDTLAFFLPTDDNKIHIKSEGYDDIIINVNKPAKPIKGSSQALTLGVLKGLTDRGYKVGGFNAYLTSNVCGGAGISSSASFEVLIAEIENFLYNNSKISAEEKAIISQFAENVYFGKPCGLLDQTAIAFGGLNKLDFAKKGKIKVSKINDDLSDYTLILINTGGSHADLTDEYASIPKEMFSVAKALKAERLIDITKKDFFNRIGGVKTKLSDRAVCRAIHFYEENERVDLASKSLNDKDYETFIDCVNKSGISSLCKLQNCFVGGRVDQPIIKALSLSAPFLCGGANRVHGGGFAGTILNIVKNENVNSFIKNVSKYYKEKDIIKLHVRSVGTIVL